MSEKDKSKPQYRDQPEYQYHDHGKLELEKIIRELETQATTGNQKCNMSGTTFASNPEPDEELKKSPFIMEPSQPEVMVVTTKIHSFDKPVFMTLPKSKVYTILGSIPVLRTPEVSTNYVEMHVINDDEIGYSIPHSNLEEEDDYGFVIDDCDMSIYVVCGKKFGTRKLDALASILLKLNAQQIIVQKYSYNKNKKSTQWVAEYNKKVTKLEHHIHKFLRNDDQ